MDKRIKKIEEEIRKLKEADLELLKLLEKLVKYLQEKR